MFFEGFFSLFLCKPKEHAKAQSLRGTCTFGGWSKHVCIAAVDEAPLAQLPHARNIFRKREAVFNKDASDFYSIKRKLTNVTFCHPNI